MIQYLSFLPKVRRLSMRCVVFSLCFVVLFIWENPTASASTQHAVSHSLKAHPASLKSSSEETSLPAYVILGHKKRLQEIRVGDDAWTLGSDGFVISWTRWEDVWHPTAVQEIPDAVALSFESGEVLVRTKSEEIWGVPPGSDTWEKTGRTPSERSQSNTHDVRAHCYTAGDHRPCSSSEAQEGPHSAMVSAPSLRDILVAEHGYYFVFQDGWYAFGTHEVATPSDVRTLKKINDREQRIWIHGHVIASSVQTSDEHAGDAHVAVCVERADTTQVIDRNLRTGEAVLVSESAGPCPDRAAYRSNVLRLSYADHVVRWTLDSHERTDGPVSISLDNALSMELRSSAYVSRRCAHQTWNVSLYSEIGGETPLRRALCAASATTVHWNALNGHSRGSGILFLGSYGSFLLMVDATTLTVHTLQTSHRIATNAQIRRTPEGTWLIADEKTGTAYTLDAMGERVSREDLVLIDNRLWHRALGGVLLSDDGHQLLVTDAGVVLNGVGIGPIVWRTLTADRRRVRQQPSLFAKQLDALSGSESLAH